jgi:hypothetical protein
MAEITRKPTARQIEALRTGTDNKDGVLDVTFDKRTYEGLVGRGLADWVQPEKLGRSVWGSALCVINEAGRAYLAKLDGTKAQQDEPDVIETPAAERLEACHYRSPQQAGTHAQAYFDGTMIKVGVREDGTARRVHGMECRACGATNARGKLEAQPCTPEREAEIERLRAITEAPTREGKRAAVRAAYAGAPSEPVTGPLSPSEDVMAATAPATLLDLDNETMPGAATALYEAARREEAPGRVYCTTPATREGLVALGLVEEEANPHVPARPLTVLTAAGWALAGTFSREVAMAEGRVVLARLGAVEDDETLAGLVRRGKWLCDALGRTGGRGGDMRALGEFYPVADGMGVAELAELGRAVAARLRVKAVADRDRAGGVISDEQLDDWARSSHQGHKRSVEVLRPLTPEQRRAAYDEASTRCNVSPGYTLSSAMWQAARDVQEGRTPAGDMADKLMAHDPDGTKAAAHAARGGSWESFTRAAGA